MSRKMTFGSLFSGIGGIDLGLERAGMECRFQVEIDDYCWAVLARHWPDVPKFKDVRDVGRHNLEAVDLVCGGFPCQPHSVAGKRQASADERDLWGEFARIVREIRPRWVLAENVPGLLSSETGRFFGRVLRDLAASGYDAEWDCIPAAAVGAPHRRDRLFIVAYANGKRLDYASVWHRVPGEALLQKAASWGIANGAAPRRGASGRVWLLPVVFSDGVADGLSTEMDRLRCLGNAVVPQVAQFIGELIVQADAR